MQGYQDSLGGGLKAAYLNALDTDEPVEMVLAGLSGEALVVTVRRVLAVKAGYAAAGKPFAQNVISFSLAEILEAEVKVNWGFGIFRLHATQGREVAIHFPKIARDKFRMAAAMIHQMTGNTRETAVAAPPVLLSTLPADEAVNRLRRLSELAQEGILTSEEFQDKKREILSRI